MENKIIKYAVTKDYQPVAAFDELEPALEYLWRLAAKGVEFHTAYNLGIQVMDQTPWWN